MSVALEAWGTDIFRQRSYVWLLASRFFVMAGGAFVMNWAIIWMERALGFGSDEKGTWVTAIMGATVVATALATIAVYGVVRYLKHAKTAEATRASIGPCRTP